MQRWLQRKRSSVPNEQITTYYHQYAKELRWGLLAAAISKAHNIQVTHDEIVEKVKQQLQEKEGASQLTEENITAFMHQLFQKENGKYYNEIREGMHWQKLFSFIKSQITVHTQEISVETLDRLVSE